LPPSLSPQRFRGPFARQARRRRGTHFEFELRDTGIGIAREDLPHVFERFYRTDKSRGRRRGGAGIGLTISAAILRAHGWTISAHSEAGRGSVFTIRGELKI
jgi:signal transduction histidine kinase